ncbi:hypothetical protein MEO93_29230, partial [Dolichospermum sp. ST_sed3]|nr:hypothetical protein [Dolichospermum sp. ST_sed3]
FMSVCYALVGLVLLYRFVPIAVIVAIAGGSNLLFYGSVDTVNSHAVSFFAVCVFLSLLRSSKRNWVTIGASLGLIALIRTQDLIYVFLLRPGLAASQGRALRKFAFGFLIIFLPQLFAWFMTTGNVISPYLTGNEGFNFLHPHILEVLFSLQNGLFLWTPIVLLGIFGLKDKLMLAVFFLQLYLVSSWSSWNQGASYSGRMFVSLLPLIAIGLSHLFSTLRRIKLQGLSLYLAVIFPLTLINTIMIISFLLKLP